VKTIVLLHGWGMNPAVFGELAAHLARHHSLCTPALPGYGASSPCDPYTLDEIVRELSDQAPERCHVAGWSLGAHIALHWARTRPGQVERLALMAATPSFVAREDWSPGVDPGVLQAFSTDLARDVEAVLTRFVSLQAQCDRAARTVMQKLRAAVNAEPLPATAVLQHGLDILRTEDFRPRLGDAEQHTLIVHGENDQLVPLAAARYLVQALPHARLETVAGAAHAPFASRPEAVSRLLSEHFDGR